MLSEKEVQTIISNCNLSLKNVTVEYDTLASEIKKLEKDI